MGVGDFVGNFAISTASGSVADDPVDELGERKNGAPSRDADTDDRDEDEEGFEDKFGFSEEGKAEVYENEVLRELRHDLEDKFCSELSTSGHVVVGVVLHADTAEEERDDT